MQQSCCVLAVVPLSTIPPPLPSEQKNTDRYHALADGTVLLGTTGLALYGELAALRNVVGECKPFCEDSTKRCKTLMCIREGPIGLPVGVANSIVTIFVDGTLRSVALGFDDPATVGTTLENTLGPTNEKLERNETYHRTDGHYSVKLVDKAVIYRPE